MKISKEEFFKAMEAIQKHDDYIGHLYDYLAEDVISQIDEISNEYTKLIMKLVDDQEEWITYWLYELDRGVKATSYTITDENGQDIPLTTVEDLWNLLEKDYLKSCLP